MTISNKIIDGLVIIMLNISLWQGRKKLRNEDLEEKGIATSSLPPEKLASLGSKRIVSPDAVNVFMALKRRAERACLAVGTRFMGGYAIPEEKMPTLQAELDAIESEFELEKAKFIAQYDVTINAWANENPEWREAILRAVDPSNYVAAQLQCSYTALKVSHAKGAEKTLDVQTAGLRGQLEREIALAAKVAWEESFQGKLSVRKSALGKLDSINEKLAGLSFLDGSIGSLNQSVSAVLKQCAGKQTIEGSDLMAVCGILATLMGLDRIRFSFEADAASVAAILPEQEPPQPAKETQPAPAPAQEVEAAAAPQPKPKRTRKPKAPVEAQPELPQAAPAVETPAEETHFTDMVAETVPEVSSKPVVRVNDVEMEWDGDLPFGGGEAEPTFNVAPAPQEVVAIPTEWF